MKYLSTQRRRVAAACILSIVSHAVFLGAWNWIGAVTAGSGTARAQRPEREIAVTIRTASPRQGGVSGPGADRFDEPQTARDAGQSGRAHSRSGQALVQGEIVTARRVLDDPATGLVFSVYFKAIRAILTRQALLETAAESPVRELSVRFVLGRDGRVESVLTPDKTPAALQRLAERLLERAGPFPAFPSSIPHRSIAFDVLFRFDGNVLG